MSTLFLSLLAAAATPATEAAPAAPQTLQQRFDAATAAKEAGQCKQAIPLFEALERDPKVRPGSIPAAAIAVRKGACLVRTTRDGEGEAAIRAGLPRLEQAGAQYAMDVADGYVGLAGASLGRAEYALAKQNAVKALALQRGNARIVALAFAARATAFDPGPEPLAYSDEAMRLVSAEAKPSKDLLAQFQAIHARVLMNRGQTAEAYAELKKALQLSGGLTTKTSVAEASLRGDLALAALLTGDKDDARRYLAWTGAGRIEQSPFASGAIMDPPDCGGDDGLKPEDFAVVEFGIGEDGQVPYAETVYATGGPKVAAAFARAVRGWYWRPDLLTKIPLFYRAATRVELRCTASGGPMPEVATPLKARFVGWAQPYVHSAITTDWLATAATLKSEVAEKEGKGDAAGQVAAAGLLSLYEPAANAETLAIVDRALAAGEKAKVPAEALNVLRIQRLVIAPSASWSGGDSSYRSLGSADYLGLLQNPDIAADPLAADTLLIVASAPRKKSVRPESADWLKRVADDTRLPDHHPLRQIARIKLANRAAAAGDIAGAQGYFAGTGLSEQQCALIGATPALRKDGVGAGSFPMAAMEYGFEGWVRLEFDISSDGKPGGIRPIVAYPPFVFVDAAQGVAKNARYESSYRPSGGAACSANQETVRFILPG